MAGDAAVSAILQVAFARLASPILLDFFQGNRLLNKLKESLLPINAVMNDAERKHITNPSVKVWLDRVKDVVLDVEDLLDEILTEASTRQPNSWKVWNFFPASLISSFYRKMKSRMKEILDRLESLGREKEILGLTEGVVMGETLSHRTPSTSLVYEEAVFGRDDDKKIITDMLLSGNGSGNDLSVIAIVGMGGMGKSTLAQLVYNDPRMIDEFDLRVWVCVSDEFDVFRITRAVLESITLSYDETKDLNVLQDKVKERLRGKKFLLVLDDVWNEDYVIWEALQTPLSHGARGSKILVTTRHEKVASIMGCANLHQLKPLSEEESWLLFAKLALRDVDPHSNSGFEEIGKKIIKKCKGLPLALMTIGRLLHTKLFYKEWNDVLTSEMWELPNEGSIIMPALRLSYQYLPSHLKRCFAYCSLFPKDYVFEKDYLIQLWMAEGLLEFHKQDESMKELGDKCFNDLLSKSFFQKSDGEGMQFVMHDLISDLATFVSGELCLRLEKDEEAWNVSKTTRHFSYLKSMGDVSKRFEAIYECDKLRTFLPLHMSSATLTYVSDKTIHDVLSKLKCLRVLCLSYWWEIVELPDSIVNLKHLRYLDLSGTRVKKLPDSICLLYNLQILKLSGCSYLEELPSDMHKLINLCHLDFRGTKVRKVPRGLGKLKNLKVFCSFYVGKVGESNINQLAELNLQGTLQIQELQNVADPVDALHSDVKNKIHLEGLLLQWSMNNDSQKERDVLHNLQPHKNLKWLCIENYGGTKFPDWFGDNSLSNIVSLKLINCKYCYDLPPLGILPSLKELWIEGLDLIDIMGPEFFGNNSFTVPFGSLKVLKIVGMAKLAVWECQNAPGAFPCLQELLMMNCPKLKKQLPGQLSSLLKLEIFNCKQLVASFPWMPAIDEIHLQHCGNLKWESPPSSLKSFTVFDCPNMEFPISHSHAFFETVSITESCNSLKTFPLGFFPKLKSLKLFGCRNFESFSILEGHDLNLNSLTSLEICDCPKLVSFPEGFSASKLEWCWIDQMESLKALPKDMHILFPSLKSISLLDCPELESFTAGGLPSNLRDLTIYKCPKLFASLMKWNLDSHTSLVRLKIGDENVESFPDQGLLPPTLTHLYLWQCSNLQTLNYDGLCQLSSLEHLCVEDCPRLQCLPNEGLPSSLSTLEICGNCPLIKQRCQRQSGEDWSKIAHIDSVKIDDDII